MEQETSDSGGRAELVAKGKKGCQDPGGPTTRHSLGNSAFGGGQGAFLVRTVT